MAKRVTYSGRVQGVGFRATAAAIASDHAVQGWVRNLSDDRVELLVDGPPEAVEAFLNAVRTEMARYIRGEESVECEAGERLEGFNVRY